MGSSSSVSRTDVSNSTSTTTTTFANAFNNALNTTQSFNFSGGGSTFGDMNWGILFAIPIAIFGAIILFKRKH